MAGKKDPDVIVHAIFNELEKNGLKTLTEIGKNIKSGYHTVKRYVDIIQFIQSQPKIIVETTETSKASFTTVKLEKKEN